VTTNVTETQIQAGLKTALQAMAEFADASVVINDWGVLDGTTENAPYVIITTSDDFTSRQDSPSANDTYNIPVTLFEAFTDWPTTLNHLQARRTAIITLANQGGTFRSAGQLESVTINAVRSGSRILPYYEPGLSADEMREATPQFLMQEIVLETEVF
jgi:hypothetical protein